ncbi:MAG: tRNA pseudouridine(55) synthase TruB [Acutalibacter sp.]|nr:tRNA pseudouridine(55) synthase TruB [Acutalibacter sp.]
MNGIIVLDKPADFTSFDAVAVVRGLSKERKIGHTGTLDPMATGVLPLLLGRAAKAADLLPDTEKAYRAKFRLGERRDTGDVTGQIAEQDDTPISREILQAALENFQGEIFQIPPMYSAVSVGGKRLYELARKGIEVEREPRKITISRLELGSYEESTREGVLLVTCSKGTYIRVLIEDIARAMGTCGTMTALRRVYACGFSEQDTLSLEELRRLAAEEKLHTVLRPVESLFGDYPGVQVTPAQETRFCNGGSLSVERLKMPRIALTDGLRFSVYGAEGQFLGLAAADVEKNELRFLKKFV